MVKIKKSKATAVADLCNEHTVDSTALQLLQWGIHCVPVPHQQKSPSIPKWNELKIKADEVPHYFSGATNIGALNGAVSANLVDVDVDAEECKPFLKWLPDTGMIAGREGNLRSHFFYRLDDGAKTRQLKDDHGVMLIEVRGNGSQTIIPPSVHPEGGKYIWEKFAEPTTVERMTLMRQVEKIAAAALISRAWKEGARHELSLGLAGALLRHAWTIEETIEFVVSIAKAMNDPEAEDRAQTVLSTAQKLECQEKVTGIPSLEGHLGEKGVALLVKWLHLDSMETDAHEKAIEFFNQSHAVVIVGGQTFILRESKDHHGHDEVTLMRPGDLKSMYANDRVIMRDLLGRLKDVCTVDLWLRHEQRRGYQGIVFAPQGAPAHFYNLFKGFAVKPTQGDCALYLTHLLENICQGNTQYYDYLLNWMAHLIQRPAELPGVAIVFRGAQGTGKGVATEELGRLVDPHFIALTSMEQLVGRFTGHLKDRLLIYANEALWGGNKAGEGALKSMITDSNASVEQKFKDTVRIDNYKRVMISSNEDWAVPVGRDDRRFFVLNVGAKHKEDTQYFAAIIEQMRHGGSEALMHFLLHRDLGGFDIRKPPATPYNFDLKLLSMDTSEQFIYEFLRDAIKDNWETEVKKKSFHQDYIDWCQAHGKKHKHTASIFGKHLKQLIPSISECKKVSKWGGPNEKRAMHYIFPDLAVCRQEFEKGCKATPEIWSF